MHLFSNLLRPSLGMFFRAVLRFSLFVLSFLQFTLRAFLLIFGGFLFMLEFFLFVLKLSFFFEVYYIQPHVPTLHP